jgi:hypothetical protein
MTEIDPGALLADMRAKKRRADAISARARSKLGVSTAAPRRGTFRVDPNSPFAFLYEGGADPDDVTRDARAIKNILGVFKRSRRARSGSVSIINLPSGRSFRFDKQTGEASPL